MLFSYLNDAIVACEQALQSGTNFGGACLTLGNLLQGMGRFQEAIGWHTRALQTPPDSVEVYVHLGELYAQQQQHPQAIAAYEHALRLNPKSAEAYRGIANLYSEMGEPEKEVEYRYQAVLHKPSWATSSNQLVLGNSLLHQGKVGQAIDCYRRAVHLREDAFEAHYNLAVALSQQRQWREAMEAFRQALEHNPDHADSHFGLGKVAEQVGNVRGAISRYHLAIERNPTSVAAYTALGELFLKLHEWQKASPVYHRLAELIPDQSWVYHNLGYTLVNQQRWAEAAGALRRAIELDPDRSWSHHHLGDALMYLGHWPDASEAFRQAIQLNPSFSWSYHNLAEVLSQLGEWEEVGEVARQAIGLDQTYPWAYTHLGRSLTHQGNQVEATRCYQKAAELHGWESCVVRDYQFTQDWFSHNIPTLQQYLGSYAHLPGLQFLEIGSFQGMSACWFFDHILTHPSARLTCIEPNFQPEFAINVVKAGITEQLMPIVGNSHEILPTLLPLAYDVIYIDGCHWAFHVERDGVLSWQLLKRGGLMIFDDYHWSDPDYPGQDTKIGIDAFLKFMHGQYHLLHCGYQLIIQKI